MIEERTKMSTGIKLQNIQIGLEAKDWKEAIRIASEPLIKCDSIEEPYVENMINSVETLGPYIVIMPQFALAHAAPCEYVKKSDISIATFKNDIEFHCDNDPVRIVMCLACTDKTSHIEMLQSVATTLMDEEIVAKMVACTSEEELYSLFQDK